jgi:hypothetical protein
VIALDLWSPHHGLSIGMVVLTAFLLGVVHGVTPDEHGSRARERGAARDR